MKTNFDASIIKLKESLEQRINGMNDEILNYQRKTQEVEYKISGFERSLESSMV